MCMTILFFGRLSDRFGPQIRCDLPDGIDDLAALTAWLEHRHDAEGLLTEPSIKVMVDKVLVHDNPKLKGGEEIGFLPPVGGG